jgi:hypothetical protein
LVIIYKKLWIWCCGRKCRRCNASCQSRFFFANYVVSGLIPKTTNTHRQPNTYC